MKLYELRAAYLIPDLLGIFLIIEILKEQIDSKGKFHSQWE
jgi:hypothetical protein